MILAANRILLSATKCLWVLVATVSLGHADELVSFGGPTMGTSYLVKVFDPPSDADDLPTLVDAELRQVNSEMSTYLQSSEITQFNRSASTDWFPISPGFASVVAEAIKLGEATDGAFDVTIGPIVDAWNFGAAERTGQVPNGAELAALKDQVGYKNLAVQTEPPAIKKRIPHLEIDLSSIAKGHGVDRVVERLTEAGCENVFVEIGGEVRVTGSKGSEPWKVGIQKPDQSATEVFLAYPIGGTPGTSAMATSGDYRNFFEVDGERYSHTIDPETMQPVKHDLASVTVVAADCMTADAWATALNVIGDGDAGQIARNQGLHTLLISRQDGRYSVESTGDLAAHTADINRAETATATQTMTVTKTSPLGPMFAVTAIALGLIIAGMAIGVIFGKHSISGSCGGIGAVEDAEGKVACSLCSNPADACKDLRARMKAEQSATSQD